LEFNRSHKSNYSQERGETYKNCVGPDIIPFLLKVIDIEVYEDKSLTSKLEYLPRKLIYLIKE